MLVTGLTVEHVTDMRLPTHFEMMVEIDQCLRMWSPATFIGHNSIRFDETMLRHGFYRALLDPYLTISAGNRRADTLRLARTFNTLRPGNLVVPNSDKGRPIFQLGPLCLANGLGAFEAHDALADVEATIKLARRLRSIDPNLFDHLVRLGSKAAATSFVDQNRAFVCLNELGGQPLAMTTLFNDPARSSAVIAVNLAVDPAEVDFNTLKPEEPVIALKANGQPVFRRIVLNRAPCVTALDDEPSPIPDLTPDPAARAAAWHSADDVIEKALKVQRSQPPYEPGPEVEEQIYAGFVNARDKRLAAQFITAGSWSTRAQLISEFQDLRLKTLAARLVAQHEPNALPESAMERYHAWLYSRLDANETDLRWLTRAKALAELDKKIELGQVTLDAAMSWRRLYRDHPETD